MGPQFIPMPWDEISRDRWSPAEYEVARRLREKGLEVSEIADKLAELGFPVRDNASVSDKLRRPSKRRTG